MTTSNLNSAEEKNGEDNLSSYEASTEAPPTEQQVVDSNSATSNSQENFAELIQDSSEYPQGARLIIIVVALMISLFLVSLDQTILATAIPRITDQFKSISQIAWYGSAFFMTLGGFQSTWGKAFKYFSLKIIFLLAILIFELGSLICDIAPNSTTLVVGRAVAGLGAAGIGTGAYTIIGFAEAPYVHRHYWRILWYCVRCFYINLPIGGLSSILVVFFFKTPSKAKPVEAKLGEKILQMDPIGTILVMGAAVSYLLALQYGGQTKPWSSGDVVGLLCSFGVLSIAFIAWEFSQGERAMMVMRIMRYHPIWVNGFFAFFSAGSYYIAIYYLPIYFQSINGVNPTLSGVRNLPLIMAVSIGTVFSGLSISKTRVATPLMAIATVIATIGAGLLYSLDAQSSSGKWIGYQIISGIGWGVGFQIPMIVAQNRAKLQDLASVTAIILFFQTLGGAFFVSAAQAAFVNQLLAKVPLTAPEVDPSLVVATGATQLRAVFDTEQIQGILLAYMAGIKVAYAIGIGGIGLAFIFSLLNSWRRLQTAEGSENNDMVK